MLVMQFTERKKAMPADNLLQQVYFSASFQTARTALKPLGCTSDVLSPSCTALHVMQKMPEDYDWKPASVFRPDFNVCYFLALQTFNVVTICMCQNRFGLSV